MEGGTVQRLGDGPAGAARGGGPGVRERDAVGDGETRHDQAAACAAAQHAHQPQQSVRAHELRYPGPGLPRDGRAGATVSFRFWECLQCRWRFLGSSSEVLAVGWFEGQFSI